MPCAVHLVCINYHSKRLYKILKPRTILYEYLFVIYVKIIVTKNGLDKLSAVALLPTRSLKYQDVKVTKSIRIQNVCPHQQEHGLLTHTNSDVSRTIISVSHLKCGFTYTSQYVHNLTSLQTLR
jgi:hypothetical protein